MRKTILVAFILFALTGALSAQQFDSIQIDGQARKYLLYLPENLPKNAPLVFVFHDYSGDA